MRSAKTALALAFLVFSRAASLACQLSLLSAAMQQPLNYNPFEVGPTQTTISFTLKNADGKPCDAAFAFFAPGSPQASGPGGSLAFQILASTGPAVQTAVSPPAMLPPSAVAEYVTVGAKQTYTAKTVLSVPEGQVVLPGSYSGTLYLGIYQSAGGGQYAKSQVPAAPFSPMIGVSSVMTVSFAGGGRKTTLNFGDFIQGATRSVQLQAYSNTRFHLTASSDNAGVMKPVDKQAQAEGIWQVPYTVSINRTAPVSLSQNRVVSLWPSATPKAGIVIPVDVQVGSISGQRAGIYRDVVTVTIDALP